MSRRMTSRDSLAIFCLLVLLMPAAGAGQTPASRTYNWIAELVAADSGTKTITVKARIPEYISKYASQFKPGERVLLVWNMLPPRLDAAPAKEGDTTKPKTDKDAEKPNSQTMKTPPAQPPVPVVLKTESDLLLSITSYESLKGTKIDSGYILPAEFVSADAGLVTVKLRIPDGALRAVTSIQPGTWMRATSPMSQPTDVAAVSAVVATANPGAAPK